MESRTFKVSGEVYIDKEDVFDYLGKDIDDDSDYIPTEEEWLACAYKMFNDDTIYWLESSLE